MKTHKQVSQHRAQRRAHCDSVNLIMIVAIKKSVFQKLKIQITFLSFCLVILRSGYLSKLRFTSMSIVSFNGILVNRLQTLYDIINLSEELTSCISLQNDNESFAQYSVGIIESSMSVKNFAKLLLYVPMEKTIGRNANVSVGNIYCS